MSNTKTLLEALGKPFPPEAIKTRQGGGNSRFSYVAGFTIIHRLNDATGGVWDWDIKTFDFRPLPPDKYGKEQSLVVVTGILTIPGLGSRAGIGVQKVSEGGGEDLVKGASTDALKKAATLFGVALELYGDDYEDEDRVPPQRPAQPAYAPRSNAVSPLDSLLARIRDDNAQPEFRRKALHTYYLTAESLDDLDQCQATVALSGVPTDDLRKAYDWHARRIGAALAPPAPAAPPPPSYAG